ncbi:HET-domain-containing protein [Tothia fuscella]|uniref:HET-domain-containing protein n=1 Tax=Tothia fuscella TaxID=1048955 RepID=A0A9P4P1J6_9PEZI|nr:HET-domain-containing protein [Tothia fuscella]
MKRMLGKLRKKADPPPPPGRSRQEIQDILAKPADQRSRQEMLDVLANLTITATVTHEAIPNGNARPLASGSGPSTEVSDLFDPTPPLRNRVHEVCAVCLDLDPTVDPNLMDYDSEIWLQGLADRHAMRTINTTLKGLQDSVDKGCNVCKLIESALFWAFPAICTPEKVLVLRIRAGLPLRVSLHNPIGKTRNEVESGLHDVLRTAMTGRNDFNFSDLDPPLDELEFYHAMPDPSRWRLPKSSPIHPSNRKYPLLGYACLRHMNSTNEEVYAGVKLMLQNCETNHEKCQRQQVALLPDRVLDIDTDQNSSVRLVETRNQRANYLALSYRWGSRENFTTTEATYAARKAGIQWNSMPALIRDTITIARRLSIRYVWIDALCIIQGSVSDWEIQSVKMGDIYTNAYITLAAASADSVHDNILSERAKKWQGTTFNIPELGQISCRRPTFAWNHYSGEVGEIATRAWTMQERLLSSRVLTYTDAAIRMECLTCSTFDCQMPMLEGITNLGAPRDDFRNDWQTLVQWYSTRNVTNPNDRLPAISALARQIRNASGWSYTAGLWAETFPQGLCWSVSGERAADSFGTFVAPSWSWASLNGPVKWVGQFNADVTTKTIRWDAKVVDVSVKVKGQNDLGTVEMGSSILLQGVIVPCTLDIPDFEANISDKCILRRIGTADAGINLIPDTPLYSPGISGMQDARRPAVARYTPTVAVPEPVLSPEPWTGGAYCLQLGTITSPDGTKETVGLVLGNSLIERSGWERLALIDKLPGDFFDHGSAQLMRIY